MRAQICGTPYLFITLPPSPEEFAAFNILMKRALDMTANEGYVSDVGILRLV